MVTIVAIAATDADAAEHVAHHLDTYLETLLDAGLLTFRIGRDRRDASRLVLIEEWSSDTAYDASAKRPAFAALQRELAPLLDAAPAAAAYEIVAAGFADDDDD